MREKRVEKAKCEGRFEALLHEGEGKEQHRDGARNESRQTLSIRAEAETETETSIQPGFHKGLGLVFWFFAIFSE